MHGIGTGAVPEVCTAFVAVPGNGTRPGAFPGPGTKTAAFPVHDRYPTAIPGIRSVYIALLRTVPVLLLSLG